MIDKATEARIKAAASIVDVISDFRELHKHGQDYDCLCPFHDDRHMGSFKVSARLNTYKCFSCGASGDSIDFLMRHEGLSYTEALLWLAKKYGIDCEGSDKFSPRPAKPRPEPKPLPMLVLPLSMVEARQDTKDDVLCNWLRSLPWEEEQRSRVEVMLRNYKVGHARQGHTIFWQIDEEGKVRTGKMMLYKTDGHRDRETAGNFSWIHNRLNRSGHIDLTKCEFITTLFGMHLLNFCPNATVHIVESEKTALICSILFGDMTKHIWMACGGKTFLTRQRLLPIIKEHRYIILYPDHDGVEEWEQQAATIGYDRLFVQRTYLQDYWQPSDGDKADIADIFIRMLMEHQQPKSSPALTQMIQRHPNLNLMIQRLNLEEVNGGK